MACILLWSSAVRVHDSQAYRKIYQYATKKSPACMYLEPELSLGHVHITVRLSTIHYTSSTHPYITKSWKNHHSKGKQTKTHKNRVSKRWSGQFKETSTNESKRWKGTIQKFFYWRGMTPAKCRGSSLINRSLSDLLPTPCAPTNTRTRRWNGAIRRTSS